MEKVLIIEALDQGGTVSLFDTERNLRTEWMMLEGVDYSDTEEIRDFISNQGYNWHDASDLEVDGIIQYRVLSEY